MENLQRAAVLLLGMGEDNASEVLRHMNPKQVQKIGMAMNDMAGISQAEVNNVIRDFLLTAEEQTSLGMGAESYIKTMLIGALGSEKANSIIERIVAGGAEGGLEMIKWMDPRSVADLVRNEHPQIISILLNYLEPEQAAEVVTVFDEKIQPELMLRMATIDAVQPEALDELNKIMERQLSGGSRGKSANLGGVKAVADIMNLLDSSVESNVMEALRESDEELAESIQDLMFVFDDFERVDGRSIQAILKEVSSDILLLALKGADPLIKEKYFENMSKRASELLRDDMDAKGPVKVSEVEAAQKEILLIARRLADSGEISLGGPGGDELVE